MTPPDRTLRDREARSPAADILWHIPRVCLVLVALVFVSIVLSRPFLPSGWDIGGDWSNAARLGLVVTALCLPLGARLTAARLALPRRLIVVFRLTSDVLALILWVAACIPVVDDLRYGPFGLFLLFGASWTVLPILLLAHLRRSVGLLVISGTVAVLAAGLWGGVYAAGTRWVSIAFQGHQAPSEVVTAALAAELYRFGHDGACPPSLSDLRSVPGMGERLTASLEHQYDYLVVDAVKRDSCSDESRAVPVLADGEPRPPFVYYVSDLDEGGWHVRPRGRFVAYTGGSVRFVEEDRFQAMVEEWPATPRHIRSTLVDARDIAEPVERSEEADALLAEWGVPASDLEGLTFATPIGSFGGARSIDLFQPDPRLALIFTGEFSTHGIIESRGPIILTRSPNSGWGVDLVSRRWVLDLTVWGRELLSPRIYLPKETELPLGRGPMGQIIRVACPQQPSTDADASRRSVTGYDCLDEQRAKFESWAFTHGQWRSRVSGLASLGCTFEAPTFSGRWYSRPRLGFCEGRRAGLVCGDDHLDLWRLPRAPAECFHRNSSPPHLDEIGSDRTSHWALVGPPRPAVLDLLRRRLAPTQGTDDPGARAALSLSTPHIDGPRDRGNVLYVINKHREALIGCYADALRVAQAIEPRLLVRWRIMASGDIVDATLIRSDKATPALSECVLAEVSRMEFSPRVDSAETTVTYSFVFRLASVPAWR